MCAVYIKWTGSDIEGLSDDGLGAVLTEIDARGNVVREIGINTNGSVAYTYPSSCTPKQFERGIFDGAIIDPSRAHPQITLSEFDRLWNSL